MKVDETQELDAVNVTVLISIQKNCIREESSGSEWLKVKFSHN